MSTPQTVQQTPETTLIAMAELLLRNGAAVNEPSFIGSTPLNAAVANGLSQLADFLKKHGGK